MVTEMYNIYIIINQALLMIYKYWSNTKLIGLLRIQKFILFTYLYKYVIPIGIVILISHNNKKD